MKRVDSQYNTLLLGNARNLLKANGIECFMRNDLATGVGEIPPIECWPELWIVDDARFDEAIALIRDAVDPPQSDKPWVCAACGEEVGAEFGVCWNCGTQEK